jgi:signal transduction histidine kinase
MKRVLKKYFLDFNFLTPDGVASKLDEDEKIKLRLVNYLALLSTFNMLIYLIIYAWIDFHLFKYAIIFLSLTSVFNIGIIILNIKKLHQLAKLMLAILTPLFMSLTATVFFGNGPGFQVFLFVGAMIPMFIWSYKESIYRIIIVSSCVFLYIVIEFAPPLVDPIIDLPENYVAAFLKTNIAACFSSAGIAIGSFQFLYHLKEQQLMKQTKVLENSQAHKDKIYSIIAHDLRSPFGSITGLIDLLFKEYDRYTDEKRLRIIRLLHGSSNGLQSLLENLLNWSRMQSGNIIISKESLNLSEITEDILSLHKAQIQKKELQIHVNIMPNTYIHADRHMASTILRNLLSNAIKFTDQKGFIQLSAKEVNAMIQICVKDSGIGLSEKSLDYLFDIEKTDKISGAHPEKGSGLGLLICKEFVESNEGKIWAKSELGKGSDFYFTLPSKSIL